MSRKRYLSDKLWYERSRQKLYEHEEENGLELLGVKVRVSDFVKNKILSGRTKALVIDGELILFHKGTTGHWVNNSRFGKDIFLHREVYKQHTGLTDDDLLGYEVHHIDGDKDNNDISNLKLLSKKEHAKYHLVEARKKQIKSCEQCGKLYSYINPRSRFCSEKWYRMWRYHNERKIRLDTRVCKNCGKEFTCNKYKPTKFCSKHCAAKFRCKEQSPRTTT